MLSHRTKLYATVAAAFLPLAASEVEPQAPPDPRQIEIVSDTFSTIKSYWVEEGVDIGAVELVFLGDEESACGVQSEDALGIYCPDSQEVFMTTENFDILEDKKAGFTASATFVVAHELGHAVQEAKHSHTEEGSRELEATCLGGSAIAATYPGRIAEEFASRDDTEARFFNRGINGIDCIDIFRTGLG